MTMKKSVGLSRRSLLKGTAAGVAASTLGAPTAYRSPSKTVVSTVIRTDCRPKSARLPSAIATATIYGTGRARSSPSSPSRGTSVTMSP